MPSANAAADSSAWTPAYPVRIRPDLWGESHWTVLLYVEKRCVENQGLLSPEWMRINPSTHYQQYAQGYAARRAQGAEEFTPSVIKAATYPGDDDRFARKGLVGHDEYDCLDDLIAAGYVRRSWPTRAADGTFTGPFGTVTDGKNPVTLGRLHISDAANYLSLHSIWTMTERGWVNAHALRRHLAAGADPHDFVVVDDT